MNYLPATYFDRTDNTPTFWLVPKRQAYYFGSLETFRLVSFWQERFNDKSAIDEGTNLYCETDMAGEFLRNKEKSLIGRVLLDAPIPILAIEQITDSDSMGEPIWTPVNGILPSIAKEIFNYAVAQQKIIDITADNDMVEAQKNDD